MGVTRRRLIGGAAAGSAGLAVPAAAQARTAKRTPVRKADVVVVGAGIAGLTAARHVAAKGRSVIVLEARGRVGGRTLNHDLGNGVISEIGGQWIGPTQDHVAALARELGIATFPTYDSGQNVYVARGQRSTFSDTSPLGAAPPDPLILADVATSITRIDQMSTQVPVDRPWEAANAELWDGQTLETWLRANTVSGEPFMNVASAAFEAILGAEARDPSLLFALFYTAAAGNETTPGTFERIFNVRGGAQERRFVGGSQRISLALAKDLGRSVVLRSPVRAIAQSHGRVRVTSDRMTVRARRAIVAVPPPLAGRIAWTPHLGAARDQLMQRMPMGSIMKCEAVYDEPFWRADGLTGQAVRDTGPAKTVFDNSPPEGKPGILLGFVAGDEARRWSARPAAERRAAVLANFAECFGPKASSPRDWFEQDWTRETWSGGGPVSVLGPGTLLRYGHALREPVGLIHWAGTETATYWNGYMDGAVRSGERAAAEVLAAL